MKRNWQTLVQIDDAHETNFCYSLKVKDESTHITIEEVTSSRQWLTVALREFIVGQDFAVPAKAVVLLQLLT